MSMLTLSQWLMLSLAIGSFPNDASGQHHLPARDSAKVTKDMAITQVPLTVAIPLSDAVQRELQTALMSENHSITLTMRNLTPPKDANVTGFSVFVEKTDATAATSEQEEHYVGSRAFGAKNFPQKMESHVFNVKAAFHKSRINPAEMKEIHFTFVPLSNGGKIPESTKITFTELEISATSKK